MDLEKLSPAPWIFDERVRCMAIYAGPAVSCFDDLEETVAYIGWGVGGPPWEHARRRADWSFCALARNAFDIMMRRGWSVDQIRPGGTWIVSNPAWAQREYPMYGKVFAKADDPFTALVLAEKWYIENAETTAMGRAANDADNDHTPEYLP